MKSKTRILIQTEYRFYRCSYYTAASSPCNAKQTNAKLARTFDNLLRRGVRMGRNLEADTPRLPAAIQSAA